MPLVIRKNLSKITIKSFYLYFNFENISYEFRKILFEIKYIFELQIDF